MIGAVILQIFLIFLNSIFSSAEIAIVSLTEADIHKLEEDGDRRAKKLEPDYQTADSFSRDDPGSRDHHQFSGQCPGGGCFCRTSGKGLEELRTFAFRADSSSVGFDPYHAGSRLFYDGFWKNDSTEAGREKGRFHRSSYVRSSLSDFGHPHAAGLSPNDFQQSGAPSFRHRSL